MCCHLDLPTLVPLQHYLDSKVQFGAMKKRQREGDLKKMLLKIGLTIMLS